MRKPKQRDPVRAELQRKRVDELKRMCSDFGIPVCRDFTKADLIDALAERMCGDLRLAPAKKFLDENKGRVIGFDGDCEATDDDAKQLLWAGWEPGQSGWVR